ncbi:histamine receptor H2a [Denticeps clupeoides]|uniref:histamine receptor H2a n=1 Tax=Denticeps clupeoides TaxID=299321 RepID=UPI0010A4F2CA|nr:histamine H2 receptor-like [Denticeps clupeoides]
MKLAICRIYMKTHWKKRMWPQILLGVLLSLLILVTVCGNVLVCLAVCATRRLRCVTNCFIVSLAITDLLLGALVLPFSAFTAIRRDSWPLGAAFCNIFISLDVMLCTASILNLLAISVDRYLAVTTPLRYSTLLLPRRVGVALVVIWLVSVGLSFVPIHMGWNTLDLSVQNQGKDDQKGVCNFELNPTYAMVDALFTFYLPLVAMCWSYCRVFHIARDQAKRIIATRRSADNSSWSSGVTAVAVREHKATVTLAAVLGAFVICWFPYFTYFTVKGLQGEKLLGTAYSVVVWLGYTNSALNPFLYAALNRDFRSAYGRLLRCRQGRAGQPGEGGPPGGGHGRGDWEVGLLCGHTHLSCQAGLATTPGVMLQEIKGGLPAAIRNVTAVTGVSRETSDRY